MISNDIKDSNSDQSKTDSNNNNQASVTIVAPISSALNNVEISLTDSESEPEIYVESDDEPATTNKPCCKPPNQCLCYDSDVFSAESSEEEEEPQNKK